MKTRGFAVLVAVIAVLTGCSDSSTAPPPPGQPVIRTIDDLNYVRGRFFFLVRPARTIAEGGVVDLATLRVWRDDRNGSNDQGAIAGYGEIDATAPADPATRFTGAFDQLQPLTDYTVSLAMYGDFFPVIELKYAISSSQALGISYEETLPGGTRRAVGTVDVSGIDTVHVQLLQAPNNLLVADASNPDYYEDDLSLAPFNQVRDCELKNVYDLQASNIDRGQFHLEVRRYNAYLDEPNDRVIDGGSAVSYLQILGLDLFHDFGVGSPIVGPDGNVDRFTNANFVDFERGLLYFPDLRPFDPRISGRADARPEEDLFFRSRISGVDPSMPGLRKLVLWPKGLSNPPGSSQPVTPVALWANPTVYDKRNLQVVVDRRYYIYAKFNGATH